MDPADIQKSFDIFFEQIGFNKQTGVPTVDTLKRISSRLRHPGSSKEGLIK